MFRQHLARPAHHFIRQSSELGDFDSVTAVRRAWLHLPQEDNPGTGFFDRDGSVGVGGDEGYTLDFQLFVLDELYQRVELPLGEVGDQVRRDDDVELGVAHGWFSLSLLPIR